MLRQLQLQGLLSLEVLTKDIDRLAKLASTSSGMTESDEEVSAVCKTARFVSKPITATDEWRMRNTDIYIPHFNSLASSNSIKRIRELGLNPVPHIAARRLRDGELEEWSRVNEEYVTKVLVVGGGNDEGPVGPFHSAMDLCTTLRPETACEEEILLPKCNEIGFAGHPDGNPFDADAMATLEAKVNWAKMTGLKPFVVTQICFDEQRLTDFLAEARVRLGSDVPVYCGITGPVSLKRLQRMVRVCSPTTMLNLASLSTVKGLAFGPTPSFIQTLLQNNVDGFHVFCFGNLNELFGSTQ